MKIINKDYDHDDDDDDDDDILLGKHWRSGNAHAQIISSAANLTPIIHSVFRRRSRVNVI